MDRATIVRYARETLGTPYQHQQRINGLAMDCAGVVVHVAHRLGMSVADVTDYGRLPVPAEMRAALERHLSRVQKNAMQCGDVVWLHFNAGPQHFGIVGDYPHGGFSLIHAYNAAGLNRVVEHRLDDIWQQRIVSAWRFPGIDA